MEGNDEGEKNKTRKSEDSSLESSEVQKEKRKKPE